jgi:hypothetical protein
MRELDMNKILAITSDVDYIAHRTALRYAERIIDGIEDPILEDLRYRYEDMFLTVRCAFEKELKDLNVVKS